jgi:hypothetical protein
MASTRSIILPNDLLTATWGASIDGVEEHRNNTTHARTTATRNPDEVTAAYAVARPATLAIVSFIFVEGF